MTSASAYEFVGTDATTNKPAGGRPWIRMITTASGTTSQGWWSSGNYPIPIRPVDPVPDVRLDWSPLAIRPLPDRLPEPAPAPSLPVPSVKRRLNVED